MKKGKLFTIITVGLMLHNLSLLSLTSKTEQEELTQKEQEKVSAIIDNSCIGCHNTLSKNDKAKRKLDFKTMDDLSEVKKISTLKEIVEAVEGDEMPPKKFLNRYPDKALTQEEKTMLKTWSESEIKNIINK